MGWDTHYKENAQTPLIWPDVQVVRLVNKLKLEKGAAVLDLACGEGRHSRFFVGNGYNVTGIDESPHALATVKRLYNIEQGNLMNGRAIPTLAKIADESFALVLCWGLTHYMEKNDIPQLLQEICRVLKQDAHVIISFTSTHDDRKRIDQEKSLFTKEDVNAVFENSCLQITQMGLTENTFYKEEKIESYYWLIARKKTK